MKIALKKILFVLVILFVCSSCSENNAQTNIINVFSKLSFSSPIDIQHAGDNSNRLFIVSQEGIIQVFENNIDVSSSKVFLDIRDQVLNGGEQGLLGLAFHPDYESNGFFYVNYTTNSPRRTVISRFSVSTSDPELADPTTELILLEVEQPYSNHNGGQIAFGPDGFLYISFGDGGSGGDPENRAQNLSTLLGKMLRIDINKNENGKNYSIPTDNPFIGNSENWAEEIYAYGLRNAWRFSFDNAGRLWAADVGQNSWEEISIIENGGNYGWRIMEGFHCFNPSNSCDQDGLISPIWEYGHTSSGGYSITGGYIYEGIHAPDLVNKYVYADFVTGNIWAYDPTNQSNELIINVDSQISTFGVDEYNDLYFADHSSGLIYKFIDDNINSVGVNNPSVFQLNQNYPNPFNPSTVISYSIGDSNDGENFVNLNVFNTLGEKVATLVNDYQTSGYYQIEFNSKNLGSDAITSGVYFYSLKTNNHIETKKMVMLN
jgi:Glucose / Sorbosone dehydrogenase